MCVEKAFPEDGREVSGGSLGRNAAPSGRHSRAVSNNGRRACEPHDVLEHMKRKAEALRPARWRMPLTAPLATLKTFQEKFKRRRREAIWQRLGWLGLRIKVRSAIVSKPPTHSSGDNALSRASSQFWGNAFGSMRMCLKYQNRRAEYLGAVVECCELGRSRHACMELSLK